MAQPVLIGLIGALALVAGALFTLIGVLLTTRTQFRLGNQTAGIQQQTVDIERMDKLSKECEGLRHEISTLWEDIRLLRAQFAVVTKQQETERKAWAGKRRKLLRYVVNSRTKGFRKDKEITRLNVALARAEAERDVAREGQAAAEGGLQTASQTIRELCPQSSSDPQGGT